MKGRVTRIRMIALPFHHDATDKRYGKIHGIGGPVL